MYFDSFLKYLALAMQKAIDNKGITLAVCNKLHRNLVSQTWKSLLNSWLLCSLLWWQLCLDVTWSDKMGLVAHLQVLRWKGFKFSNCCSSPMKAATCMVFTLFKPTSYLHYHPEYKKPATMFPAILDGFYTKAHSGCIRQASPWVMGGGGGRGGGKGIL